MSRIAIISTKKLPFPPTRRGVVMMDIELIQILPHEEKYELTIIDRCLAIEQEKINTPIYKKNEETGENDIVGYKEETVERVVEVDKKYRPGKTFTFKQLDQLSAMLKLNREQFPSETQYINEMFRQGLIIVTQKECMDGLSGEGTGMYFSKRNEWKIYRDEDLLELVKNTK